MGETWKCDQRHGSGRGLCFGRRTPSCIQAQVQTGVEGDGVLKCGFGSFSKGTGRGVFGRQRGSLTSDNRQ